MFILITVMIIVIERKTVNYRNSQQRDRILELLRSKRARIHPTAEWVYHQLKPQNPSLSLGTVYRNLNVLVELGVLERLYGESGVDRYEIDRTPHYHLICERCGGVEDVAMESDPGLIEKLQPLTRFKIKRHRIEFYGLCNECQKND